MEIEPVQAVHVQADMPVEHPIDRDYTLAR